MHTPTHAHRQTGRRTDRQIARQTDIHLHTCTYTTHTHTYVHDLHTLNLSKVVNKMNVPQSSHLTLTQTVTPKHSLSPHKQVPAQNGQKSWRLHQLLPPQWGRANWHFWWHQLRPNRGLAVRPLCHLFVWLERGSVFIMSPHVCICICPHYALAAGDRAQKKLWHENANAHTRRLLHRFCAQTPTRSFELHSIRNYNMKTQMHTRADPCTHTHTHTHTHTSTHTQTPTHLQRHCDLHALVAGVWGLQILGKQEW